MVRNLASYRVGMRVVLRLREHYDKLVEVRILEKAPKMLKIQALDSEWWAKDSVVWVRSIDVSFESILREEAKE